MRSGCNPRRAWRGATPKTGGVNWSCQLILLTRERLGADVMPGLVCLGPVGAATGIHDQLYIQMHCRVGGVFHH